MFEHSIRELHSRFEESSEHMRDEFKGGLEMCMESQTHMVEMVEVRKHPLYPDLGYMVEMFEAIRESPTFIWRNTDGNPNSILSGYGN